jgi:hypothetical protein
MIDAGSDNFTLATLGPDGELPATRIGSANTAWNIADQLARDNVGARAEAHPNLQKL